MIVRWLWINITLSHKQARKNNIWENMDNLC